MPFCPRVRQYPVACVTIRTVENERATGIQERHVDLGPFFALGAVFLVLGIFRRSLLAVAAGIGAIWLDQRSELGRALKTRLDRALKARIKGYARS